MLGNHFFSLLIFMNRCPRKQCVSSQCVCGAVWAHLMALWRILTNAGVAMLWEQVVGSAENSL